MYKTKNTPLYKRLIEDLQNSIEEGVYKKGDYLPSENELCKSYDTTRATVRQALLRLTNMGYISRQQGKRSVVSEPKKGLGVLSMKGVTAGVGDYKLITKILEKPLIQNWPSSVLKEFELSDQEMSAGCVYFSRLRFVNDTPIFYEETYISNLNILGFTKINLENKSLLKELKKRYKIKIKGGSQKIFALLADKTISEILDLKVSSPILHLKRKLETNVEDVYVYSWLYCNTQDYYLDDYF